MIRPPWVWLVAVLAAALPSATVRADGPPSALVRVGTHQGYSRIAFNFSTRTEYTVARQGDRVTVQFADNAIIGVANAIPRNVVSIIGGTGRADIVVAAGTTVPRLAGRQPRRHRHRGAGSCGRRQASTAAAGRRRSRTDKPVAASAVTGARRHRAADTPARLRRTGDHQAAATARPSGRTAGSAGGACNT